MNDFMNLLPFFIVIAIVLVVILTEMIKLLDVKERLKGYRVYIPLVLSFGTVYLLQIGNFFIAGQIWFWWSVIFGFSVFGYEAILRKIQNVLKNKEEAGA